MCNVEGDVSVVEEKLEEEMERDEDEEEVTGK